MAELPPATDQKDPTPAAPAWKRLEAEARESRAAKRSEFIAKGSVVGLFLVFAFKLVGECLEAFKEGAVIAPILGLLVAGGICCGLWKIAGD